MSPDDLQLHLGHAWWMRAIDEDRSGVSSFQYTPSGNLVVFMAKGVFYPLGTCLMDQLPPPPSLPTFHVPRRKHVHLTHLQPAWTTA